MEAIVLPVLNTTLNTGGLIQACREMQQPNPAASADAENLTGLKHTIAVIDEIQRKPYLTGSVMYLGYMIITWPDEMASVLAYTRGMPHLYHDGVQRCLCALVMGSIDQWTDVCRRACVKESDQVVRFVFNKVYRDMQSRLPIQFTDLRRTDNEDGTFMIESN